jgi:hypothetical protein
MKQNLNSTETTLKLNIAEFLAEYFTGSTSAKDQFSYGLFWDTVMDKSPESIKIMVDYKPKDEGSFYYEYGLLKAEEEMEAEQPVTEKLISRIGGREIWAYKIRYENPDEKPVSFYFYTRTRIMAFIQYENETLEVAWEMQEITKQKPVLCLESHTVLFRRALDCILEAYSKGGYSDEDIQREYCPDATDVAVYKMRYKFTGSYKYRTSYCEDDGVTGNNVCNAIDAAWTWLHTGLVNNFISRDLETHSLNLNW